MSELGLRTAARLGAGPSAWIRLGLVHEARKRWADSESAYVRAASVAGRNPRHRRHGANAHYRLARLLVRRKDWLGADAAYAAALELRPEVATWHGHRGQAQESNKKWDAAAASFAEAARLEPEKADWTAGLVRVRTGSGDPVAAIEAGTAALERAPDDYRLLRAVAAAHYTIGNWPAAADLLRRALDRRPGDRTTVTQLIDCLELQFRVPFLVDPSGRPMTDPTGADGRAAAWAEAVDLRQWLAKDEAWRPGPVHKLALLYERGGRMVEAAESYRAAMALLAPVDGWWCHRAAHEWAFRLAYVEQRTAPTADADPRLGRVLNPVADTVRPVDGTAGFFDVQVTSRGLHLNGFLLPGAGKDMDIHLDGQLVRRVTVDQSTWRPTLRYDLTNGPTGDFPECGRLTVSSDGRPLVTLDGAQALEIRVPGGTGEIKTKLASGIAPSKKGAWPPSPDAVAGRQTKYLGVYERVRDAMDEQGRKLFLCYGTLLGCYRDARFIPGDDDFDAGYVSLAPSPEAYRQECFQVALDMLRHGFDVSFSIQGRAFKVCHKGVWIDLTSIWFYRGRAWGFDAHDFTLESIEPVQTAEFLGRKVYLPGEPEAFLADTYGPDWRVPQPSFKYYRSDADATVLSQMWATPSEVREFTRRAADLRAAHPGAGRFRGLGYGGYPGFSWLSLPDGTTSPPDSLSRPAEDRL